MSKIRNTAAAMKDDPAEAMLFLAEGMVTGSAAGAIERQERDGQRQLVNSDRLPSDARGRADFEALGFTFGDPDPDDPIFTAATLPPGWKRKGSDHAMWSYITDELGRDRVAIFYKAAFYDRSAHMHLESLDWYVTKHVEGDGPLILDEAWATRDAVLASMAATRDHELGREREFRGCASPQSGRDEKSRQSCARIADERAETVAKYEAAIKALAPRGAKP